MGKVSVSIEKYRTFILGIVIFIILYVLSTYNYLLFHSIAEVFSILVAFVIFVITWNSRKIVSNSYLVLIGTAYLFVGIIDLIHTLAYKGMGIFGQNGGNLATQLWIVSRYIESFSLLLAPLFFKKKLKFELVFLLYFTVTLFLLLSIFYWRNFPFCYIEGIGLTAFKKISEYVIALVLFMAMVHLWKKREELDNNVFKLIVFSIAVTILSEFFFTFYLSVYGIFNLIGHFMKILSFYLIYKAIVVTGIVKPFDLLFRDLKQSEVALKREKDFVESLIETAQIIVLALDKSYRIVRYNTYMADISGYRLSEVQNKDFFDTFIPNRHRLYTQAQFMKLPDNTIQSMVVSPIVTRRGDEREIEWRNRALKDSSGTVIGILAIGQDVTERKHAEKTKEQLIIEIQDALDEVRVLRSLLTICPCCKRIKDENGYWHTMEFYKLAYSSILPTNQILCPDCEKQSR